MWNIQWHIQTKSGIMNINSKDANTKTINTGLPVLVVKKTRWNLVYIYLMNQWRSFVWTLRNEIRTLLIFFTFFAFLLKILPFFGDKWKCLLLFNFLPSMNKAIHRLRKKWWINERKSANYFLETKKMS